MFTGTAIGAISDASHYDFADDFIAKVEKKIEVGTVTIIAEVEEYNEAYSDFFIENYLKPLGAVITRSDFDLEFDRNFDEQIEEIEGDIAVQRAALNKAVGDNRKKIQAKIAELKERRRTRIAEITAKSKEMQGSIKDKISSGVAKVKADIEAIGNNVSTDVKNERMERIKRRIGRHQDVLNALNSELKELQS